MVYRGYIETYPTDVLVKPGNGVPNNNARTKYRHKETRIDLKRRRNKETTTYVCNAIISNGTKV